MKTKIQIGKGSVKMSDEQAHAFSVALGMAVIPYGWHDWRDTLRILGATERQKARALKVALSIQPPNPKSEKRK